MLVEGEEEFEIERIVAHRATRGGLKFVVRWKGYGPEEDKWMRRSELQNAPDIMTAWEESQAGCVGLICLT